MGRPPDDRESQKTCQHSFYSTFREVNNELASGSTKYVIPCFSSLIFNLLTNKMMKKLLFLLLFFATFVACSDDDNGGFDVEINEDMFSFTPTEGGAK